MKKLAAFLLASAFILTSFCIFASADSNPKVFNDFSTEKAGVPQMGSSIFTPTPQCSEITFVQSPTLGKLTAKLTGTMSSGDACVDIVTPDDDFFDASGKDALEFWVDISEFTDPAKVFKIRVWTGPMVDGWQYACVDLSAETPFLIQEDGKWVEKFDDYGRVVLPEGYKGYVRIPTGPLMASICPYEGNGKQGDIKQVKQIRFYWSSTKLNKFSGIYFGDIRFVDTKATGTPSTSSKTTTSKKDTSKAQTDTSKSEDVSSAPSEASDPSDTSTVDEESSEAVNEESNSVTSTATTGGPKGGNTLAIVIVVVVVVAAAAGVTAFLLLRKKGATGK